jgi:hypothetical protein
MMKPPSPILPVSSFVLQSSPRSVEVIKIDPKNFGGGRDNWNLRNRFSQIPPRLHNNRTIGVMATHAARAYMDQPLCQATPVVHAHFDGFRWGKSLYENLANRRTQFLKHLKILVEANCAPGQVKAIQLAVFEPTVIHSRENARYLDQYDEKMNRKQAGRYVYYGIVTLGERYTLVHQDPNGLERYYRTNVALERGFERMAAINHAEDRLRKEGIGVIFMDYCSSNPLACLGLAATIAAAGGSSNSGTAGSNSQTFASCTAQCLSKPQMEQPNCRSLCYEFITR